MGLDDINNVQSLILFNIGDEELTVGELTHRGYYLGTNVTYNLKKLVENGYVSQERSSRDRRSVRIKLSDKGADLCKKLHDVFDRHADAMGNGVLSRDELIKVNETLKILERFWSNAISFRVPGSDQGSESGSGSGSGIAAA